MRVAHSRATVGRPAGIRKYRHPDFNSVAVRLMPGYHYVSSDTNEMIVTVLGSCVAACVRDPVIGVGGMNHFMLPHGKSGDWGDESSSLRYGNFAMERLIDDIVRLGGCKKRLEVKVFGGSSGAQDSDGIGCQNAAFVESYLTAQCIPVRASRLREERPLRVHYFPVIGRVLVRTLDAAATGQDLLEAR